MNMRAKGARNFDKHAVCVRTAQRLRETCTEPLQEILPGDFAWLQADALVRRALREVLPAVACYECRMEIRRILEMREKLSSVPNA